MVSSSSSQAGPSTPRHKPLTKIPEHDKRHWITGELKVRFGIWNDLTDPVELATFHNVPTPGYTYTARDVVTILTNHCTAAKVQKLNNKKWLEVTAFYREDDEIRSQELVADAFDLNRRLRAYVARLDHDFFFGILSSAKLIEGTNEWQSTGQSFVVDVVDSCNTTSETQISHWSPREKLIQLWTQGLFEGDAEVGSGKGKDKAEVEVFTQKFHRLVQQIVYQLCHVFLSVAAYYPAKAEAKRQREVAKDGGEGEQFLILYNFIMQHLAACAPAVQVYAQEAMIHRPLVNGSRHVDTAKPKEQTSNGTGSSLTTNRYGQEAAKKEDIRSYTSSRPEDSSIANRNNGSASDSKDEIEEQAKEATSKNDGSSSEPSDEEESQVTIDQSDEAASGTTGKSADRSSEAHVEQTKTSENCSETTKDESFMLAPMKENSETAWWQLLRRYWLLFAFVICSLEVAVTNHFGINTTFPDPLGRALIKFARQPVITSTIFTLVVAGVFRVIQDDRRPAHLAFAYQTVAVLACSLLLNPIGLGPAAFTRITEGQMWYLVALQWVIILELFGKGTVYPIVEFSRRFRTASAVRRFSRVLLTR